MRKTFLIAALLLSSLTGCAITHEQVMLNAGCQVGEPDAQCQDRLATERLNRWRITNCQPGEEDHQRQARLDQQAQELIAARRAQEEQATAARKALEADPTYQATYQAMMAVEAQGQAAERAWAEEMAYRQRLAACTAARDIVALSINN